jgi:hypothetical protein
MILLNKPPISTGGDGVGEFLVCLFLLFCLVFGLFACIALTIRLAHRVSQIQKVVVAMGNEIDGMRFCSCNRPDDISEVAWNKEDKNAAV